MNRVPNDRDNSFYEVDFLCDAVINRRPDTDKKALDPRPDSCEKVLDRIEDCAYEVLYTVPDVYKKVLDARPDAYPEVLYFTKIGAENTADHIQRIFQRILNEIPYSRKDALDQFNAMIEDCKQGKIDMIFTKSISRFARNTLDCLQYIRLLKEINIPVFFEKESINTMDAKGEVLITIMASLAQQESESLSKNTKMGIQYRFQQGKVMVNAKHFLGYDKDEEGHLIINPAEAEIIKRIFREYLEGFSCQKIARGLERDGILTSRGNPRWHDSTVRKILENEKYMGDALLQKTYTIDFLNKKRGKNNGVLPQYYIEDDHEAIIPKEIYMKVQEEIARRSSERDKNGIRRGFSANNPFSQIITCECCGAQYRRIHWYNHGKKSIVWRCKTRMEDKTVCTSRTIHEELLQQAFVDALNEMIENSDGYLSHLKENLKAAINLCNPQSAEALAARMNQLQQELLDRTESRQNYDDLVEEILLLREQQEQTNMDEAAKAEHRDRIQALCNFINSQPRTITKFDGTLVRKLLKDVKICDVFIEFRFKSGTSVIIEK